VSSAQNVTTQRTQATAVAAAINAQAKPGDVIAFCPDRLGPSVYRQIHDPSQYDMVTFPRRAGPQVVDWVDYADAVNRADPGAFATDVAQKAGTGHHLWLVWQPMYKKYGVKCETIAADLQTAATKNGGSGRMVVTSHTLLYSEPMNLSEYAGAGS
jgi:mannosyltransferase